MFTNVSCFHKYFICFVVFITGSNGHITYGGVTEDGFVINPLTGVITTTKELDTEVQDHYTLTGNQNMLFYTTEHALLGRKAPWFVYQRKLSSDNFSSVYARDGGLPANFAKAVVRVEVQDVNDNIPIFAKSLYELEVPENQDPVELCFIKATDPDSGPGGELEYRIAGER